MTSKRIAILIDGGFFLKRLPKLVQSTQINDAAGIARSLMWLCKSHIVQLTGNDSDRWQDHLYRTFYYDAVPYTGQAHHPLENRQIDFGKSSAARLRNDLFDELRKKRKVALRLGKVTRESDWAPPSDKTRRLLATKAWLASIDLASAHGGGAIALTSDQVTEGLRLQQRWQEIQPHDVRLGLKQKGVDMRIGLDIASITLKRQATTIVLVAGDSDFVPAAKLARREGVEFILDPLWQSVNDDLFEHIDGLQSGIARPRAGGGNSVATPPTSIEPGE